MDLEKWVYKVRSPCFSKFRELLDLWDEAAVKQDLDNKVKSLVDGPKFSWFFKKGKNVYGGSEDSRVVFAKMKSPDEDMLDGWDEEATFMAVNLTKVVQGQQGVQTVFAKRDLAEIEVLDRDRTYNRLKKQGVKKSKDNSSIEVIVPRKLHLQGPQDLPTRDNKR